MLAIETERLSRRYGSEEASQSRLALDDVSLAVEEGEVRGLLGPNGAGKTTLVKILSTVLLPSSGRARVLGHDVVTATHEVRSRIGIVFGGDRGLYNNLTAQQNLEYWAALYDVPPKETKARIDKLLGRVGLTERAKQPVSGYSRGMKQRLHLARGLIAGARVLFLDEPTMGMDPMAARDFRQLVRELRSEGCTVLLTTHDMREAEALCDRVALIDRGKLLAVERPAELARYVAKYERIDVEGASEVLLDTLRAHGGVATVNRAPQGDGHRIELADGAAHRSVLALLVETGVTSITTSRPSLEEVYVHLIGRERFDSVGAATRQRDPEPSLGETPRHGGAEPRAGANSCNPYELAVFVKQQLAQTLRVAPDSLDRSAVGDRRGALVLWCR